MFCKNCGKQLDDTIRFCDGCGEPTADAQSQTPPPQQGQQYTAPQYQQPYAQPNASTSDNTKLFSILAYIGPLFLVGLLADPNNPKVKFHVNQGLVLFLAEIVLSIVVTIVNAVLVVMPVIGGLLVGLISLAQFGATITLAIMGIMNAVKDEEKQLPFIGNFTIIK